MKNLKRFRSWIAFVVAACKSYLQQRASVKAAEDRPNSDPPQTSCSATVVTAQQIEPATQAVATSVQPETTTLKSKPVDVPAKAPTVQVTTDITPANGKAHQSAQRLARVLISEIKLYYLNKIEGQDASEIQNIYDLLKDPIDKSRQHYEQRVGADAASMPDYFHGELVKTLCAGDESRLGPNYTNK